MFWGKEQTLDAARQGSLVKQSRPGWLFTERTPGTHTTNHSCSAELPLGDCGRERDIFQMFLCISSFRKRAAVSSQQKGRTPTAALIIFLVFLYEWGLGNITRGLFAIYCTWQSWRSWASRVGLPSFLTQCFLRSLQEKKHLINLEMYPLERNHPLIKKISSVKGLLTQLQKFNCHSNKKCSW